MNSDLVLGRLETDLVPGEVEFAILAPRGCLGASQKMPLLLNMHGGGLDRNYLAEQDVRALFEKLWSEGALPTMLVACYSARGSWHLNYHDGSERWEDFAFEFQRFMQHTYNTEVGQAFNYLTGISMGAMGALRLALKFPDQFGAVAAMEGVINPVLDYDQLEPRNFGSQHNLPPEEQAKRWGWPVDRAYYHANNHANIARDNAAAIRAAAPKIYLECGDHDFYNAQDGAEFLHRVMWENRIAHEYRLLQDCDHVGASLVWREEDAHRWLGRMAKGLMNPISLPEPTAAQQDYAMRAWRGQVTGRPNESERVAIDDDTAILVNRRALPEFLARYADDPFGGVFRARE